MNNATQEKGSLDEMIRNAAQILGKSAEQVEQELTTILGPKSEDWHDLIGSLGRDDNEYVKFGDFMKAFHDDSSNPSPIALVRKAVAVFSKPGETKQDDQLSPRMAELKRLFGVKPTLQTIDSADLFKAYMADKASDPVTVELKKRYGEKAIVAFKPGTKDVAVEETIAYITDVAQGLPEQTSIYVDGDLARLFPVGKTPTEMVDEDPVFQGKPLIRGRSTVNSVNWTDVPLDARQLINLAVMRGDVDANSRINIIELARMARKNGFAGIKDMFPEATLNFNEQKEEGTLPRLKIRINGQKGNNPFLGRNKTW